MNKEEKKLFDLHKGGASDIRESGSGFRHIAPRSPEISVREKADKTRDPLEFGGPVIKELNYSRHLHKPATEAISPRNPEEIADNSWRPFNEGKGGLTNTVDDNAGKAGVHNYEYEAPPEHDFLKNFGKRKP
jgi:hypothetical protein